MISRDAPIGPDAYRHMRQDLEDLRHENAALRAELEAARRALPNALPGALPLIDMVHDAILTLDPDLIITGWSRGAEDLYGWTAAEALGRPVDEIIPTDWTAEQQLRFLAHLREHGQLRRILTQRSRDGRRLQVESHTRMLQDESGAITGFLVANLDITGREQARETLSEIIESISDGFITLGENWAITYINARAAANGGRTPAELIGKNIWETFPRLAGTELERVYRRVMVERKPEHFSWEAQGARPAWYDVSVNPTRGGISVYWVDQTERILADRAASESQGRLLESEEKLRVALEASGLGVWEYDPRTDLVTYGPRAQEIYGSPTNPTPHEEEIVARMHPDDVAPMRAALAKAAGPDGGGHYQATYRLRQPDGTFCWVNAWGRMQFEGQGPSRAPTKLVGASHNITAQKLAEQELRQAEETFEKAFRSNPAGLSITRLQDGCYLAVNDSLCRMLGYSREEMIGSSAAGMASFVDPAQRDQIIRAIQTQGGLRDIEINYQVRSGEPRSALMSIEPLEIDGQPCLLTTALDITGRKQAEEGQRQAVERLELLNEMAAQFLTGEDPAGQLHEFFERFQQELSLDVYVQYNLSKDGTHLHLNRWTGFPEKYYRLLKRLELGQAVCGTVAQAQQPMYVNDVQHLKDRKTTLIRAMGLGAYACHPLIAGGRLLGTLSFGSRSLTHFDEQTLSLLRTFCQLYAYAMERNQAVEALSENRELLHAIIDNANAAIFAKDFEGRFILSNRFHAALFDRDPRELVGLKDTEFNPADNIENAQGYQSNDQVVLSSGQPVEFEEVGPGPGGGVHTYLSVKFLLRGLDGTPYAVCGISTDITERKQTEEALNRYALQLEQVNRDLAFANNELRDFAYIASHDLQEPLRKVSKFSELIRMKYGSALDESGQDYLIRMVDAAGRMQEMIQGLLDYSRVSSRGNPFQTVDLAAQVRDVLTDLEIRIEQTRGQVEVGPLPVIEADPLQMRQLLQNLIGNALKFHQPGTPPSIRIAAQGTEEGDCLRLVIEDNGVGFSSEHLDKLFKPFMRLHGRSEYEGTGMGLAICRKIVERHGGSITAESRPGEGARFIVVLPRRQTNGTHPGGAA